MRTLSRWFGPDSKHVTAKSGRFGVICAFGYPPRRCDHAGGRTRDPLVKCASPHAVRDSHMPLPYIRDCLKLVRIEISSDLDRY